LYKINGDGIILVFSAIGGLVGLGFFETFLQYFAYSENYSLIKYHGRCSMARESSKYKGSIL